MKKKATPSTSWEQYRNLFSSDDEEEKQDDIEIITEKQGLPRKMATDNSKPKPEENIERSKSNNENPTKRLNEKKWAKIHTNQLMEISVPKKKRKLQI